VALQTGFDFADKAVAVDLVPNSIPCRRKSPYPTTADPRYEKDLSDARP